jgi:hypothetical protein
MKIVSLVPSIAEAACMLGLEDSLVGITGYCLHTAQIVVVTAEYTHTKPVSWPVLTYEVYK